MNEIGEAPSAWRLLWSPKAMAWWACFKPLAALRIGSAALAVAWGTLSVGAVYAYDEPFGESTGWVLTRMGMHWLLFIAVFHGWTWLTKRRTFDTHFSKHNCLVVISAVPGMVLIASDGSLSMYREAVRYGAIDPSHPSWPPLPEWLEQATQTWAWFLAGIAWWVIYGIFAGHSFSKFSHSKIHDLCTKCHYDLTGTRAAGIGRCPECGAGVVALGEAGDAGVADDEDDAKRLT